MLMGQVNEEKPKRKVNEKAESGEYNVLKAGGSSSS